MKSIELLDSWISNKIRSWSSRLGGEARAPELLEIRRELLNNIRDQIQPAGNGRFIFPYRNVHIHLAAANEAQWQVLDGAFAQNEELQQDFSSLLTEAGCPIPDGFHVEVSGFEDAALAESQQPFRMEYSNPKLSVTKPVDSQRPSATVVVLRGDAEPREYVIQSDRVYLGRLKEVVSETGSLRRRNDVAFAETETTVSREHAFITYDHQGGVYRLHDSRSQRGTSAFRDSRELRVPKGSARGIELRSGDEIHLGEARLAFTMGDSSPST